MPVTRDGTIESLMTMSLSGPILWLLTGTLITAPGIALVGQVRPSVDTTGILLGLVTEMNSGEPIVGARVVVVGGRSVVTGQDGRFRLTLRAGEPNLVRVQRLGYQMLELKVDDVVAGEVIDLGSGFLLLEPLPVMLPPTEVVAPAARTFLDLVGFNERKSDGLGEFLEREHIEEWQPRVITDLLRRLPGVRITPNRGRGARSRPLTGLDTRSYIVTLRNGCEPTLYFDGSYVGGAQALDIDVLIPANHVEGIELYRTPGEVPSMFRTSGHDCGVIAFWTRRPTNR